MTFSEFYRMTFKWNEVQSQENAEYLYVQCIDSNPFTQTAPNIEILVTIGLNIVLCNVVHYLKKHPKILSIYGSLSELLRYGC